MSKRPIGPVALEAEWSEWLEWRHLGPVDEVLFEMMVSQAKGCSPAAAFEAIQRALNAGQVNSNTARAVLDAITAPTTTPRPEE